jgi:predicted MFS family arabinose efflux permease
VRHPEYGRIFLLTFLSGFTFTIFTFAFQPFFLNVLGQDARSLALMFAGFGIIGFGAQVFGLDPLRRRFPLVQILAFMLAARGLLFLLIPTFPTLTAFALITVVFSAVNSFPLPLIESLLSLRTSAQEQGQQLGDQCLFSQFVQRHRPRRSPVFWSALAIAFPFG